MDVKLLKNGCPAIDPMGAQVGPYRTMTEAVATRTMGLQMPVMYSITRMFGTKGWQKRLCSC